MTPTIVWLRDGVGFEPAAAASFRRAEASWGRQITVNSSYRDYDLQLSMWEAWNRYVASGYNPRFYPGHSRALHPAASVHCLGRAADFGGWSDPAFVAHMADHGWIRTAADDPTERHHFEYQWWRDNHRNDPTPAGGNAAGAPSPEEDDMPKYVQVKTSRSQFAIIGPDGVGRILNGAALRGAQKIARVANGGREDDTAALPEVELSGEEWDAGALDGFGKA